MSIVAGADPTREPSFTLRNRLLRAAWGAVWLLLFRPSPRPLHRWRAALLRLFGARLGRNVHVYPSARIWAPWSLEVGADSGIGERAIVYNMAPITIGHHCTVSQGAHLCAGSHDVDSANFQLIAAPIVLEPYVWVCADAFVGMNVRLAEGAVVGARAVVVRDLAEPWTVYAGNPARRIRTRRHPLASTRAGDGRNEPRGPTSCASRS
jgi:putative colanic acid biosynthesis acetyltransferase WcaF